MEQRTILFVDQVGSTRKLADLGDEAMVPIRQRLWSIVNAAVTVHDGRVFSDEGDGGAAVFSRPESGHAAALEVSREALAAGLELRVGLHTGSVVANGDGFVGLAVHAAARLCDAAPPGCILTTSDESAQGTDQLRRLTPFGQRSFKGFPEPVEVMLLTDPAVDAPSLDDMIPSSITVDMASSPLLLAPSLAFVGRDNDLDRLLQLGAAVRGEMSRVALVAGEAGAGKSTLAHRAARSLVADGAVCLVGRSDDSFDDPFHEIIELLGHLVREAPVDLLADHVLRHGDLLTRWLPGLGDRVPSAARSGGDADRTPDRLRLFEAVLSLLRSVSAVQPLVLVLEDLHWATPPTLDLVRYLLDDHGLRSVLVLVTYRSTEVEDGSPLAELLARQSRNDRVEHVSLDPLTLLDVEALVEVAKPELVQQRPDLIGPLAAHLIEATRGNALFCAEFLRHVDIDPTTASDADSLAAHVSVPASVQELACHRIDQLGVEVAEMLAVASVLGERFRLRELQRVLDESGSALLTKLERAERAEVVRPVDSSGAEFSFGHALVRDALYERMTTSQRLRWHRSAADVAVATGVSSAAEVLAHLTSAGPLADPVEVWRTASQAADDAVERLALLEAISYRQRAVEVLEQAPSLSPSDHATTVFALGREQTAIGMAVGGATMVEAAAIARRAADWDLLAEIAVAYGGDLKENQAALDVSRPVLLIETALGHHTAPTAMRARLSISLALWQRQTMSLGRRRALVDEAIAIAESLGDSRTFADVLAQRHRALHGPDAVEEGLGDADRLDELAVELDDDLLAFQATNIRMMATFQRGDWGQTRVHAVARDELGERLRSFEGRRLGLMWQHLEANVAGDYGRADSLQRRLQELISLYPDDIRGRFSAAAVSSRLWLAGHSAMMYEMMPPTVNRDLSLAWFAAESGQIPAARQHLESSGGVARMQAQSDYMWSHDVLALTRASRALSDADVAGELYDVVLPFRHYNAAMGALTFLGAMEHHLGSMAVTLGRLDDAVVHFDAAIERHEGMGAVPYLALTQAELAGVLSARNAVGDADRARSLAAGASTVAEELGLALVLSELDR